MKLNQLANKAKKIVDERGGTESLKEDAQELKGILGKKGGSFKDKAKEAAAALKEPGAHHEPEAAETGDTPQAPPPAA